MDSDPGTSATEARQFRILLAFGTRPEAVKMAPLLPAFRAYPEEFDVRVAVTAQHRTMLDQFLQVFGIHPDHDLNIMQEGQRVSEVVARALTGMDTVLSEEAPDLVLVQGDTATVFATALAAFFNKIPVGHVEAGLRTSNKYEPFPEEIFRRTVSDMTDLHFAPTAASKANLLCEGIREEAVFVTGNTVVDALLSIVARAAPTSSSGRRTLLVTCHRRENWGEPMREVCLAIKDIVEQLPDVEVVFPMHKNPIVREVVEAELGGHKRVQLTEPPDYLEFIPLMQDAYLLLTDSGGIQEEAPSLHKPVLVLRRTTERPEGIEAGTSRLVGTDRATIREAAMTLLTDPEAYAAMSSAANPYGDGRAAERIVEAIRYHFGLRSERPGDFAPRG